MRTEDADRRASEGKLPEVGVARAASLGRFAGGIVAAGEMRGCVAIERLSK